MTLHLEVAKEKILCLEQVKCKPCDIETVKQEIKPSQRLKRYLNDTWALRSKITVEPFVLCYVFPSVLAALAVQNLGLEKACLVDMQYSNLTCKHIMASQKENYTQEENKLHVMVSSTTAWSHPLQTALPGVLTLFIGSWSDRTGNRKAFMVLPILGKLISAIGIILCTVFFYQFGLTETALIEGLPPALTGGRVAMTMAVYSYITDITTEAERTFRLGIITAILTLSRPIALALSGIMTNRFGYYSVFVTACVFYLFGFLYIVIRLKDKAKKSVENQKIWNIKSVFSIKDPLATINVAFKKRQNTRRLQILLIMFADVFIVGPLLGEAQMTYWFTRHEFNFTEVDFSLFLTYSVLIGSLGSFITIYLFAKRWKIKDSVIGIIACMSRMAASILYALAPSSTVYFIGPVLDMFSSAGATSLRSMASKLVSSDEVGKISSLMSISEALVTVVYSPLYAKVYNTNLDSMFPGAFYFISALLVVPAVIMLLFIYFLQRREATCEDAATESDQKEYEISTSF